VSAEEIKAIAHRYCEVWNKGDLALLDEIMATDIVYHHPREDIHGLEEYKQVETRARSHYTDLHLTIDDIVIEGDKVATRWTITGTDKATNKQVTMWGVNIGRIEGGKIVEGWEGWGKRREGGEIR